MRARIHIPYVWGINVGEVTKDIVIKESLQDEDEFDGEGTTTASNMAAMAEDGDDATSTTTLTEQLSNNDSDNMEED